MICPICNQEMLYGYISTKAIEWVPIGGRIRLFYRGDRKDGFRIGKHAILDYKKQPSYYCDDCEIIIIDANSENLPMRSQEL